MPDSNYIELQPSASTVANTPTRLRVATPSRAPPRRPRPDARHLAPAKRRRKLTPHQLSRSQGNWSAIRNRSLVAKHSHTGLCFSSRSKCTVSGTDDDWSTDSDEGDEGDSDDSCSDEGDSDEERQHDVPPLVSSDDSYSDEDDSDEEVTAVVYSTL